MEVKTLAPFDLLGRLGDVTNMVVANLGAGHCASPISRQILDLKCASLTNVEIFEPYYKELIGFKYAAANVTTHNVDILAWLLGCQDKCVDVVLMIDVLEHFDRAQAAKILHHVQRIARGCMWLWIPIGNCPQDAYDGNSYQRHFSTWYQADFKGRHFEYFHMIHGHSSAAWVRFDYAS